MGWQCARCVHQDSRRAPVTRWRPTARGRLGNTRVTPVVMILIAVNVAVYIWEMASHAGFYVYKSVPIPCANAVECRFAMWPTAVHQGQWYRLLTAPFLHANIEHILFNMLTLAIVGSPVEAHLGKVRFSALYLVSALGGSVGSYLLSSANTLGVGASGAIFGLMGAYFVLARRQGWEVGNILALIIINLVIGFASTSIDWRAHLGGMVTGAVVALGLDRSADLRRVAGRGAEVVITVAAAGILGVLTLLPPGHVNL